jgi:hypothetical protein
MAERVLVDIPLIAVSVVDLSDTARRVYGDRFEEIFGRPLDEHDYRFSAMTPTGGEMSFHQGATAEHVAAYWGREGWLDDATPIRPAVEITDEMVARVHAEREQHATTHALIHLALEAAGFTVAGGESRG